MTLGELLAKHIDKDIHVSMTGYVSPLAGKLTGVEDNVFTMKTHASTCQYFDLGRLISFWVE